jgi:hypothetical protein
MLTTEEIRAEIGRRQDKAAGPATDDAVAVNLVQEALWNSALTYRQRLDQIQLILNTVSVTDGTL